MPIKCLYLVGSQDEEIVLYASHYLGGYHHSTIFLFGYQGSNIVPFSNLGIKGSCLVYTTEWYENKISYTHRDLQNLNSSLHIYLSNLIVKYVY